MPKKPLAPSSELKPDILLETYDHIGGIYPPTGISCGCIHFLESSTEVETVDRIYALNKTFPSLPVQLARFPDRRRSLVPIHRQTFPPHMQILPQQMTS